MFLPLWGEVTLRVMPLPGQWAEELWIIIPPKAKGTTLFLTAHPYAEKDGGDCNAEETRARSKGEREGWRDEGTEGGKNHEC